MAKQNDFKEFNNREIANKFAEYITGEELRKYLADKVKKYVGDNPTVFDGAVGSGQLEQFVNAKHIYGVEIQERACETFKHNYPESAVYNMSFFNFKEDVKADCVIMNYPFSLKYKDLTDEEKENIAELYPWKKSGVVDDIFMLKGLNHTKRYAFYIAFPGITYRQFEKKFRELIGSNLVELNKIENAFEDTAISVAFLVIDKEKITDEVYKEVYDCKTSEVLFTETVEEKSERWLMPIVPTVKEEIDIDELEREIAEIREKNRINSDAIDEIVRQIRQGF